MLKYNHRFRRLSLTEARTGRKTASLECRARSQGVTVAATCDGLVIKTGETLRLAPGEIAGIELRRARSPVHPSALAIAAACGCLAFVLQGIALSVGIAASGLALSVGWLARDEKIMVGITTLRGSSITLEFRGCTPAEERRIARTVEAMNALVRRAGA